MDDGTEFVAGPGGMTSLTSGHDAWVVGDEPAVTVDWFGASNYARGADSQISASGIRRARYASRSSFSSTSASHARRSKSMTSSSQTQASPVPSFGTRAAGSSSGEAKKRPWISLSFAHQ